MYIIEIIVVITIQSFNTILNLQKEYFVVKIKSQYSCIIEISCIIGFFFYYYGKEYIFNFLKLCSKMIFY